MTKTYIHVNQHKIRSNKKNGTNEPVITVKRGSRNDYCHAVKILGDSNLLNKLPVSASNLYSKNLLNFVINLYDKKNNKININLEDEIIKKTLIT